MRCYNSCYPEIKPLLKKIVSNNTPIFVFNIETTGLDPVKDQIIQIAIARCSFADGHLFCVDSFNGYAKPEGGTPEFVSRFTGRSEEFWNAQQDLSSLMRDASSFLGVDPVVMSWSAADFATPFLLNAGFMTGDMSYPSASIDLCRIAQSVSPKTRIFPNYMFRSIAEKEGVVLKKKTEGHDARYDVDAYIELFNKFYPRFVTGDEPAAIQGMNYYEKSIYVQRLYFATDHGNFYINAIDGFLYEDTVGFLEHVDADALIDEILRRSKSSDLQEVARKYRLHLKAADRQSS